MDMGINRPTKTRSNQPKKRTGFRGHLDDMSTFLFLGVTPLCQEVWILRRRCHLFLYGQVAKKRLYVPGPQRRWLPPLMKGDIPANPRHIRLFRPIGVVFEAQALPHSCIQHPPVHTRTFSCLRVRGERSWQWSLPVCGLRAVGAIIADAIHSARRPVRRLPVRCTQIGAGSGRRRMDCAAPSLRDFRARGLADRSSRKRPGRGPLACLCGHVGQAGTSTLRQRGGSLGRGHFRERHRILLVFPVPHSIGFMRMRGVAQVCDGPGTLRGRRR